MQRIPEPELMDEPDQALAYAKADFSEPNQLFVDTFSSLVDDVDGQSRVIDLGCGPGDICVMLAQAFSGFHMLGIDGSESMLEHAKTAISKKPYLQDRVEFRKMTLPFSSIPKGGFDYVISNSLLHHLHDPQVLWEAVKSCSKTGTQILVMDLFRPESTQAAQSIVETYAADEADVLKRDFYNSLCAAFTLDEVRNQLNAAGLTDLSVSQASDRHLIVQGELSSF
jgi:cyclopropane fatty-acyl-phospholipid synthase-like methyltransferase